MSKKVTHGMNVDCRKHLDQSTQAAIKSIMKESFAGIDVEKLYSHFFENPQHKRRDARLFYAKEQLVGYCLITLEEDKTTKKDLMGASAAFLPEYRQGDQTALFSIRQSFLYWIRKPWKTIYYASTVLSPAMYRVMAKSATIYPSFRTTPSKEILNLLNAVKKENYPEETGCENPFVVYSGRHSNYSQEELERLHASNKPEIKFFIENNPRFNEGYALLAIMPTNLYHLIKTMTRFTINRFKK